MTCPYCGERLEIDDTFCPACGSTIEDNNSDTEGDSSNQDDAFWSSTRNKKTKKHKKRTLLFILLIIFAIFIPAFVAKTIGNKGNNPDPLKNEILYTSLEETTQLQTKESVIQEQIILPDKNDQHLIPSPDENDNPELAEEALSTLLTTKPTSNPDAEKDEPSVTSFDADEKWEEIRETLSALPAATSTGNLATESREHLVLSPDTNEKQIIPKETPTVYPTEKPDGNQILESYIDSEKRSDNADGGENYIANLNTKKFHYPWCHSVQAMKESNKWYFHGSRSELTQKGYIPCKNCNP